MSGQRAPSPLDLTALERELDAEEYSLLNPSSSSSAAAAGATRGEFPLSSVQQVGSGGGVGAETPSSTFGKVVFISNEDISLLCFGKIGAQSRFCIERKLDGEEHCGTNIHARNKMDGIVGNRYYPPGGAYRGRNTARIDPSVDRDKIPPSMMEIFESGEERSDWSHIIIDASIPNPPVLDAESGDISIGAGSKVSTTDGNFHTPGTGSRAGEEIDNVKEEEDEWSAISTLGGDEFAPAFNLTMDIMAKPEPDSEGDDKSWTPAIKNHSDKIVKLGFGLSAVGRQIPRIVQKLDASYKPTLSGVVEKVDKLQAKTRELSKSVVELEVLPTVLGNLSELVSDHGSLAKAMDNVHDKFQVAKMTEPQSFNALNERLNNLNVDIKKQASSIKDVLRVITKVARTAGTRSGLIEERVTSLENARDRLVDASTPVDANTSYHEPSVEDMISNMLSGNPPTQRDQPPSNSSTSNGQGIAQASTAPNITLTSVVGEVEIGGTRVQVTIGELLSRIQTLEAKSNARSLYVGSGGFSFGKLSFPGETEFMTWFVAVNPAGKGLAAIVDIVSIWEFSSHEQVSSTDWLQSYHRSTSSGFKSTLEPHYATTFANRYPKAFVGSVDMILPTDRIKIFSSIASWRGNGIGDGLKERLISSLRLAVARHRTYCEDNLPSGTFREHAIQSSTFTLAFFLTLVTHFDDEMSMLTSIGLPEKEVMLLISNQLVQICDDLYVPRQHATNVDNSNSAAAAARYAWVSFQALDKMGEFGKSLQTHPSINTTYTRFLTRMTAEASASGLKAKMVKLEEELKKAKQDKATMTALNKVDNKLELVIRLNELKRSGN